MELIKERGNKLNESSVEIIQPKEEKKRKKNKASGTYRIISKGLKY